MSHRIAFGNYAITVLHRPSVTIHLHFLLTHLNIPSDSYIIASPYDINGMEFDAVILLGVDEGRVPQTAGTSDISQHFIKYSAYNLLYLTSSRAKYRLILLGNRLKGRSSCLDHSITSKYLIVK